MKKYLTPKDAIIDLRERGYWQDFDLLGNDLIWCQEKISVRAADFSIRELHRFCRPNHRETGTFVFGILAWSHQVMGILIYHFSNYTLNAPPVIRKKINEMLNQSCKVGRVYNKC
jgi:hypothetical protein